MVKPRPDTPAAVLLPWLGTVAAIVAGGLIVATIVKKRED